METICPQLKVCRSKHQKTSGQLWHLLLVCLRPQKIIEALVQHGSALQVMDNEDMDVKAWEFAQL